MALTDLDLLKKHVRADDLTEDDALLSHYLDAAESHVIGMTNRAVEEIAPAGVLPKQLQQAVLMTAAHWYNQRESVAGVQMSEVPYTVSALVKPFRVFDVSISESENDEEDDDVVYIIAER